MTFLRPEHPELARMGPAVVDEWPEDGVTFETTRGSFEIPASAIARATETGDDFEIRRAFAINLPPNSHAYRREKGVGGVLVVYWRSVRIVAL